MRTIAPGPLPLLLVVAYLAASLSACNANLLDSSQPATPTQPVTPNSSKATPIITWPQPAPITNPAPLTSAQLDATANVPGMFVYSPAAGTVLVAGSQTLTTTFTPNDTAAYTAVTASVTITVNPASAGSAPNPVPGNPLAMNSGHLAVADYDNNRVLIYDAPLKSGESASVVLGQPDFTHHLANQGGAAAANTLAYPEALAMDSAGNLYVADGNCRVLQFRPPFTTDMDASLVLGQPQMTNSAGCMADPYHAAAGMDAPLSLVFDRSGDLWVTDLWGARVTEYTLPFRNGMAATVAIGQASVNYAYTPCGYFGHGAGNVMFPGVTPPPPAATNFCDPISAAFDASGNLWVMSYDADQLDEFVPPFSTGMAASQVVSGDGGPDIGCVSRVSATNWCGNNALAFDGAGNLWLSDGYFGRVLEYAPPLAQQMAANTVIGHPNFTDGLTYPSVPTAYSLSQSGPLMDGLAFDSGGDLFVADTGFNRILIFAPPLSDGMSATVVLGQGNMTSGIPPPVNPPCSPAAANTLCWPRGMLAF